MVRRPATSSIFFGDRDGGMVRSHLVCILETVDSHGPLGPRGLAVLLHWARDDLVREWLAMVRQCSPAGRLPLSVSRDHLPMLFDHFVEAILDVAAHEAPDIGEPVHGYAFGRMEESIELGDCLRELQMLRSVVLRRWWFERRGAVAVDDGVLLDRALDEVTRQVVETYSSAQRHLLETLDSLGATAMEELPLDEALRKLLAICLDASDELDVACIYLVQGDRLVLRAVEGARNDEVGKLSLAFGQGLAGRVAVRHAVEFTPSAVTDPEVSSAAVHERQVRALLGAPMMVANGLVGVATLGSLTADRFSKRMEQLMHALVSRAAQVVAFQLEQEERRKVVQQLEAVFTAQKDALLLFDPGGMVQRANDACVSMLGFDPRGLTRDELGRRTSVRDMDGRPLARDAFPSTMAHVERRGVEARFRITSARGQELLVTGTASPVVVGQSLLGVVTVWHDASERERLLAQLEQERAFLRTIISEAPIGIAILDGEQLRVKEANRAFLDSVREPFRHQGVVGLTVEEFTPGARDAGIYDVFRRVQDTLQPFVSAEFFLKHADRGDTWWRGAVTPLLPSHGRWPDLIMVSVDETEQVRSRQRVEAERLHLDVILKTLPVGIIVADTDGHIVEANDQARRLWGGSAPLSGDTRALFNERGYWPDDGRSVTPDEWALHRALRHGAKVTEQLMDIQRLDGSCGSILMGAAPIRDATGRTAGAVAVILDVTEQRRLTVQLERQGAQLTAILDAIADGLVVFGPRGEIVRANAAAQMLLERGGEGMGERRLGWERMTWPDGSCVAPERNPISRALQGEVVKGELMLLSREGDGGGRLWLSSSAAPVRLQSGELTGAVSTFVDVTTMQEMRQHMEDVVRMLSHDLRTPLETISLQAQMLARQPEPVERVLHRGQTIVTSAERMNAMIQDLVDVTRLETGQFALNLRPLDVRAYLMELRERLAGALDTRRIRVDAPLGLPHIKADPDRLERIVVNLLANALKYSPPEREVLLQASPAQNGVAISVEDQGQGIAPEDLPHVFERYYRSRSASGNVQGLGLGLYVTRLLADAHGAQIKVDSQVGRGSRFTVVFPSPS